MAKVPLAEHNDMVKAVPADRTYEPLRISVLPWRSWCDRPIPNAHRSKPADKDLAIDQSRSRTRYRGAFCQPYASVSWRAIHLALGVAVTPSHKISRRQCGRLRKPYKNPNENGLA